MTTLLRQVNLISNHQLPTFDTASIIYSALTASSVQRQLNRKEFAKYYADMCSSHHTQPLQRVKRYLEKGILDFVADRVKIDEWYPIMGALNWDESLKVIAIRLRKNHRGLIESADSEVKAQAIGAMPVLTTKYVLNFLIKSIVQCLMKSPVLEKLELENLPLEQPHYLTCLSEGLANCCALQKLSLYKCAIGDAGVASLCNAIKDKASIDTLDLSYCDLTEFGAIELVRLIKNQKLNRYSEAWKQSLRYRDPDVDAMPGLRRLTLNNNPNLGDRGIQLIADELSDDLWIRAFDVQNTGLTFEGAANLIQLVRVNANILIVDARFNKEVPGHVIEDIMGELEKNNGCRIDDLGYKWLASDLEKEKSEKMTTRRSISRQKLPPTPTPFYPFNSNLKSQLRRQNSAITQREASARGYTRRMDNPEVEELRKKLKDLTAMLNYEIQQKKQLMKEKQELLAELKRCEGERKMMENAMANRQEITDDTLEMLEKTFSQFANYVKNNKGTDGDDYKMSKILSGLQTKLAGNLNDDRWAMMKNGMMEPTIWETDEDCLSTERNENEKKNPPGNVVTNKAHAIFDNLVKQKKMACMSTERNENEKKPPANKAKAIFDNLVKQKKMAAAAMYKNIQNGDTTPSTSSSSISS